jgi:ArsR family transcriptional regulator
MDIKKVEKISKALGDPFRLKMMEMVKKETEWLACSTISGCVDLSQSTVSHHMAQLVDADLLIAEKDGRNVRYKLNKPVIAEYQQYLNVFSM